jgi:hypothetical protein
MRRDLVEEVLDAAEAELFEDVYYTHAPAGPILMERAISGVDVVTEEFNVLGHGMREATHTTRVRKSRFPHLAKGDILDDGRPYKLLEWREPQRGDGRLEWELSLQKL